MADDVKTPKYLTEEVDRRFFMFGLASGSEKAIQLDPEDAMVRTPDEVIITFAKTGEILTLDAHKIEWWSGMTMRVKREVKKP